jgi:hypothetical protein
VRPRPRAKIVPAVAIFEMRRSDLLRRPGCTTLYFAAKVHEYLVGGGAPGEDAEVMRWLRRFLWLSQNTRLPRNIPEADDGRAPIEEPVPFDPFEVAVAVGGPWWDPGHFCEGPEAPPTQ